MNWATQSEEMLKSWTESQQKMWDSWMKMMTPTGAQSSMSDLWTQSVEAWEAAIKNAAGTQTEWMKMWLESLEDMPNVPDEVIKGLTQYEFLVYIKRKYELYSSLGPTRRH